MVQLRIKDRRDPYINDNFLYGIKILTLREEFIVPVGPTG